MPSATVEHFSLDVVFDPESLETVEESPVAYVTKAFYRGDTSLRPVAIKSASTNPHFSKKPHDIAKELKILTKLSHDNIINVLGHGYEQATSSLHFWMPFITYKLRDLLDSPFFSPHSLFGRARQEQDVLSFLVLARSLTYQIVHGVKFLHEQRVAHRDIKPGNALIDGGGTLKLIDFGIAWADPRVCDNAGDLWPEPPEEMCFDVATGPYRAPELLFGASSYDPYASDLWSLGTTCAEFFTPLRLQNRYDDYDELEDDLDEDDRKRPFVIPKSLTVSDPDGEWRRVSLFDASRGSIGLAWSIFKTRGTPTATTWPDFGLLPDASKVSFQVAPKQNLQLLLPNVPASSSTVHTDRPAESNCVNLVEKFLSYQPSMRMSAADALRHPWFTEAAPLVVPPRYTAASDDVQIEETWESQTLADHLIAILHPPPAPEYNREERID
ncbi:kinase-like protein [Daedalea quercina L-15889]|uniref:cyclin-dependent kinase n=1 Tax=Daedalea quercina L-15889 TaxID=1314783 RepID=A0A165TCR4_9APHY|nr:kinase-like protein [Daedalea quercina L-15889]